MIRIDSNFKSISLIHFSIFEQFITWSITFWIDCIFSEIVSLFKGDFTICCNKLSIWVILFINSDTFSSKAETFSQIALVKLFNFWSFAHVKLALFLIKVWISFFCWAINLFIFGSFFIFWQLLLNVLNASCIANAKG